MASQQHNGQADGNQKSQTCSAPAVPQQPGPAQLQLGPTEHAVPGPYPTQGPPIAGQPHPTPSTAYNQGGSGPYPTQGQPIAGQPQPILPPGFIQGGSGQHPTQCQPIAGQPQPILSPVYNQGGYGPYSPQGLPIAGQPQPMVLPGYNQGYPQVIQTQPPILSPCNREGPSVKIKLKPDDPEGCISASVECGEVSKDICSGFTTLICAGPTAGCKMGSEDGIGWDLSLCRASCIVCSCLCTLGLALDTNVSCNDDEIEFELCGIGVDKDEGFAITFIGSKIGSIDKDKRKKNQEKRQRRKERKEEKRMRKEQEENQSGDATGEINNGATVEDAL